MTHTPGRAVVRFWTETEKGVELRMPDGTKRDLCGYALTDDAQRIVAAWNATADIPVTALEQGVIAELVAFVRQIADDDKEITGPMAVALLAKLGGQHDAG